MNNKQFYKVEFAGNFINRLKGFGTISKESLKVLQSLEKIDGKLVFCYESNLPDSGKISYDEVLDLNLNFNEEASFIKSEGGVLRFFVFTRDRTVQGIDSLSFSKILFNCKQNDKDLKGGQYVSAHIYNFSKESQFLFDKGLIRFTEINKKEFPCFDKVSGLFLRVLEDLKKCDINDRFRFNERDNFNSSDDTFKREKLEKDKHKSSSNKVKSPLNDIRIEKLKDALQKGEIDAEDQVDLEKQLPNEFKNKLSDEAKPEIKIIGDEMYKRTTEAFKTPDPDDIQSKIEYTENFKHVTVLVDIVKENAPKVAEVVAKAIEEFL